MMSLYDCVEGNIQLTAGRCCDAAEAIGSASGQQTSGGSHVTGSLKQHVCTPQHDENKATLPRTSLSQRCC